MSFLDHFQRSTRRLKSQATILGTFVAAIWILEIVDVILLGNALDAYGVWPRRPVGLLGILFMPFLHGGYAHVAANTMPFVILGWLVMLRRMSDFVVVTVVTSLVTGGGLWLFGSSRSVYIGASGLIFGYFGYLLLRGYFERSPQALLLTVLVAFFYGGLVWGIVPRGNELSWEAHLLGFTGGVLSARFLTRIDRPSASRGNIPNEQGEHYKQRS
jgi:membrane associated rhomboid family serine protease